MDHLQGKRPYGDLLALRKVFGHLAVKAPGIQGMYEYRGPCDPLEFL